MADTAECEPIPSSASSSDNQVNETKDDGGPTPEKRRKMSEKETSDKLEHRLGGILCCAVCLDLPRAAVYQCTNGHLMCAPCFTHLLADSRLRDEASTCPNCRIEISKTSASRNLAVEKAVSELPSECKFCAGVFPRHSLQYHEEVRCEDRQFRFSQIVVSPPLKRKLNALDGLVRIVSSVYYLVMSAFRRSHLVREPSARQAKRRLYRRLMGCRYACIGCGWRGPAHETRAHEDGCSHPRKSAADVMEVLAARDRQEKDDNLLYGHILDLLSYEKITFNDLQLKPYRTDEFVHKLYYETSRFSAFNHQWVVKAFINKNQRDPTQSYEREITYQLIVKTKPSCPMSVHYVALRGPYGEADMAPRVYTHTFTPEEPLDSPPQLFPLLHLTDTNRLLSNKAIHFRLIMFLATK